MQDIGTLGGPDAAPWASTINERGQIAGFSYTNGTPNSVTTPCGTDLPTQDPFFWDGTMMTDIGTLGGTCGFAFALNNQGQVIGQSDLKGDVFYHPFFWEKGMKKPKDLGTLGGRYGVAEWINDAGEVVGWADTRNTKAGESRAFLWKKGKKIKDLGILKGDACDAAFGVNSMTQIIGDSTRNCFDNVHLRPFLWENGSIYDLSTLFPPGHFQYSEAVFINDSGEIAGDGVLQSGDTRPYLLIPCKKGTKGCKGLAAGTAAHAAAITQNPTTMNEGSRRPSDAMAEVRGPLVRRYPYRGFGTYQPK
jgi:probable HAF family extracellular repeat protein